MKSKVLFVINGLGMGNCTRCFAVIRQLYQAGIEIHVLTTGNGLFFFKDEPEITSLSGMESFQYGRKGNKVDILSTLAPMRNLYRAFQNKNRQLEDLLNTLKPNAVVTDSEYGIFPVRKRKIPLLAINNADVVVSEYYAHANKPGSIRAQFWLIEHMDYLLHRTFWDVILSPSIKPIPPRHPKYKRIGLIVREEILQFAQQTKRFWQPGDKLKKVVFMLSGSTFSSQIDFSKYDLPCQVEVVGRAGESQKNVTYFGKVKNNIEYLLSADVLVVNGGFSAVSEALVLKKPTMVIPVPAHAEQYINASLVEEIRRGFKVDEESVFERLGDLLNPAYASSLDMNHFPVDGHGAEQAAKIIMEIL